MTRARDIALAFTQVALEGRDFDQTVLGELKAAHTYREAGINQKEDGVLLTMSDGTEFCVTVQRY